jgi:hypothetical protein
MYATVHAPAAQNMWLITNPVLREGTQRLTACTVPLNMHTVWTLHIHREMEGCTVSQLMLMTACSIDCCEHCTSPADGMFTHSSCHELL